MKNEVMETELKEMEIDNKIIKFTNELRKKQVKKILKRKKGLYIE